MTNNTIILDGDEIAYNCAVVCEQRSIVATHTPSGRSREFKTRTDFRQFIEGQWEEELFIVKDVQTASDFDTVKKIINLKTTGLLGELDANKSEIYISGDNNFRLSLPLPYRYKSSRIFTVRPVHLSAAKDYLILKGAVKIDDREADDMLAQRMFDGYTDNKKIIAVTVDKDARMNMGWLYNPDRKKEGVRYIEGFGSITKVVKQGKPAKVEAYGRLMLYFQLLLGDSTDFYNPRDWMPDKVKFGEISAYKLLADCKDDREAIDVVVKQYKKWYPKPFSFTDCNGQLHLNFTWADCLQAIADCAYMRRSDDDRWYVPKVLRAVYGDRYSEVMSE